MNRYLRRYAQSALEPEVIAVFGEAKLVRQLNRRLAIRGGTVGERAQARSGGKASQGSKTLSPLLTRCPNRRGTVANPVALTEIRKRPKTTVRT